MKERAQQFPLFPFYFLLRSIIPLTSQGNFPAWEHSQASIPVWSTLFRSLPLRRTWQPRYRFGTFTPGDFYFFYLTMERRFYLMVSVLGTPGEYAMTDWALQELHWTRAPPAENECFFSFVSVVVSLPFFTHFSCPLPYITSSSQPANLATSVVAFGLQQRRIFANAWWARMIADG